MHLDEQKFWIPTVGFILLCVLYALQSYEVQDLRYSRDRAYAVANECVNNQLTRVNGLEMAINAALVGQNVN